MNNSDLKASKGWKKGKGKGYFLKSFSVDDQEGRHPHGVRLG